MPIVEIGLNSKGQTREEALWDNLRQERDKRLLETDYLIMPDYPITPEKKQKVQAYRQLLRDLPSLPDSPWDGGGEKTPWPTLD